ncbi:MAG TPA: hypothetical protein VLI71_05230 [Gammaproteobacteria bacterium]|nr:hypothetical protein [Gammaproteobacteria bacterium]
MAKILEWVSLNINGDQANPGAGNSATFSYCVCDSVDSSMKKTGSYTPNPPNYGATVDAMWDAGVTAIKAAEGIS